jgi:hypothetical protein
MLIFGIFRDGVLVACTGSTAPMGLEVFRVPLVNRKAITHMMNPFEY